MENIKRIETKITDIKIGDTVMINNVLKTVGKNNIKHCDFMGVSLFGDASNKIVTKILFIVPTNNGIKLR